MKLTTFLYKLARTVNTIDSFTNPKRSATKRLKNIALGRTLGMLGFWKIWR